MKLWDKELGNKIKIRRKSIGLRQTDLANRLYVEPTTISRWETGSGSPDISILPNLSYELGMTLDQLMGNEPRDRTSEIKKIKVTLMDVVTVLLCVVMIAFAILYLVLDYQFDIHEQVIRTYYIEGNVKFRIYAILIYNSINAFIIGSKKLKNKLIYKTYKHKYKHTYPAGYKFEIKESYLKFINIKLLLFAIIFDLFLILG